MKGFLLDDNMFSTNLNKINKEQFHEINSAGESGRGNS